MITKEYILENLLTVKGVLNSRALTKFGIKESPGELYSICFGPIKGCAICSKKTKYISFSKGFVKCCSRECATILRDTKPKKVPIYKRKEILQSFISDFNIIEESNTDELTTYLAKIKNRTSKPSVETYDILDYSREIKKLLKVTEFLDIDFSSTNSLKFRERIYIFEQGINSIPKCKCHKNLIFINGKLGYSEYCSTGCNIRNKRTRQNSNIVLLETKIEESKFEAIKLYYLNERPSFLKCECGFKFHKWFKDGALYKEILCPNCDSNKNIAEKELSSLINNSQINNRQIIRPFELDVYSEEHSFAIEYNGLMWHSHGFSKHSMFNRPIEKPNYHLNKTELCEEKGIHLFHIFENEWLNPVKKNIWKNIILGAQNMLEEIDDSVLNYTVKNISEEESIAFLRENSLEEYVHSSIRIGLYIENKLVQILTANKLEDKSEREYAHSNYEITRVATINGYVLKSKYSILLKHFENTYSPNKACISLNRRYNGINTNVLDFEFEYNTEPSFYYFNKDSDFIADNDTETSIMYNNGYRKIYDCGRSTYVHIF